MKSKKLVVSVLKEIVSKVTEIALLKNYRHYRPESKEDESQEYWHKESYKLQPYSVDPYLIAYAIEEQKKEQEEKEEEERLRTVPTKSVAY